MKTVIIIAALCFAQQLFAQAETIPAPTLKGGIYNRTSLGILAGEESSNISFMSSNGYRFKNNIELGVGLGLERSYYSWKAPLFLDMRYNFKLKKAASTFPFVSLIGGYEAGLNNYTRSRGGFGNASIGLTHYFTDHIGITTSLGYRYSYSEEDNQYYCFDLIYYPYPSTTIKELHRFEMRIGLAIR
jgi:hypothetical protein